MYCVVILRYLRRGYRLYCVVILRHPGRRNRLYCVVILGGGTGCIVL